MQAGDFFRVWDRDKWLFGRCRQHTDRWFSIQYFGYGQRRCTWPYESGVGGDNTKFINNLIAGLEII